ncbi:hypothetical protein B0H14DRAFT_2654282 [Mycena olivaceomarginata]|nr:hypothetical protein B0H14DRAFT_2654282 [Mycena olivaceomarginata]
MTILRSSTARARRQEFRGLHTNTSAIRPREASAVTNTGSNVHFPPLSSSATGRATTNTTWANHEISELSSHFLDAQGNLISVSFLSGVHLGDNVRKISVALKRKALHDSYKVGTKSQPRTSEESEIWEWRRALRTAFFKKTASNFEAKPSVHEQDVEEVHQLFRIMNSTLVSPLYIKSTSILRDLNKIKHRGDEFGRHAQELYNKWVNVCSDCGST